jgi:eukaryotic-like serine/threonine-protein kinase
MGKPGVEDVFLAFEADTAAYSGRLAKGRELSAHAVASARQAGEKEVAATYEVARAMREVLFGNSSEVRGRAAAALQLSSGRDIQYGAALALAFAGDAEQAQKLADVPDNRFPDDTHRPFQLRTDAALENRALASRFCQGHRYLGSDDSLRATTPYELGVPGSSYNFAPLYPVYVRGEAYLAAQRGRDAAAQFQKIMDHRGIGWNAPIGALAYLGLGRAYALKNDKPNAREAYTNFLSLWKEADPDVAILRAAKDEYAKWQ